MNLGNLQIKSAKETTKEAGNFRRSKVRKVELVKSTINLETEKQGFFLPYLIHNVNHRNFSCAEDQMFLHNATFLLVRETFIYPGFKQVFLTGKA